MTTWILQISAGTGPAPVRRFVAHLTPYLKVCCQDLGLTIAGELYAPGEEEPRHVQLYLDGTGERLSALTGTYALIARDPNRSKRDRKRWFAGVAVFPATSVDIAWSRQDLDISTARGGGPGGQYVNRTETAVRARHRPTGLTVRVTATRSQAENKKRAVALLKQAVAEHINTAQALRVHRQRKHHYQIERGRAICAFTQTPKGALVPIPR